MEVLRIIFGSSIPDAIDIVVPDWIQNPLFYGSYTDWPAGLVKVMYMYLIFPVQSMPIAEGEFITYHVHVPVYEKSRCVCIFSYTILWVTWYRVGRVFQSIKYV